MNAYDQKDFSANPGKYKLFTTATIAVTDKALKLNKGDVVSIRYVFDSHNTLKDRREPIYWVDCRNGYLYGSALADFVL